MVDFEGGGVAAERVAADLKAVGVDWESEVREGWKKARF